MENGYGDVCAKWWTYTHLKGETAHYIGKKNNLCEFNKSELCSMCKRLSC